MPIWEGDAMSDWTKHDPVADGKYWLSIAPEKRPSANRRNDFPPVIRCQVHTFFGLPQQSANRSGRYVQYDRSGEWLPLDQDWFNGAQWKRVDPDPADPFAEQPRDNSRDKDLP